MSTSRQRRPRGIALAAIAAAVAVAISGCAGASSSGSSGGDFPSTMKLDLVTDVTGLSSVFSGEMQKGWELRIQQANDNKEFGAGVEVTTDVHDTQSDPKVAAGIVGELAASDSVVMGYGTSSSIAPAIAPVAQDGGLPFVAMYSGSPDLTAVGDEIFRVTAPQSTYHDLQSQYLRDNGVKTVDIVYNNDIGTLKSLAETYYPAAAKEFGFDIVRSVGVSAKATDLSAEMTSVIADKPDAVIMLVLSQQNSSIVTQLRRANYDGIIAAQPGVGRTTLEALGADANGVVYPIDFTAGSTDPAAVDFVTAFTDKYGAAPDSFAASGYEGASLVLAGITKGGAFTRDAVKQGLTDITDAGFSGVTGDITFTDRDARVPGMMVRWNNGAEEVIQP
jgi:branched-chain amino acid transport system substrate-binding protein